MIRDGLVIPHHLDTPHNVSFVLTQKRGQLNVKQMQKGLTFVWTWSFLTV